MAPTSSEGIRIIRDTSVPWAEDLSSPSVDGVVVVVCVCVCVCVFCFFLLGGG